MTDAELLSLLQFNIRGYTRTLPYALDVQGDLQHLLGLYWGIEAGELPPVAGVDQVTGDFAPGWTGGDFSPDWAAGELVTV